MSGIRSGTEVSRWYELSARAVQEENTRRLEACSLEFVDLVRSTLGRVLGEVRAGTAESCLAERPAGGTHITPGSSRSVSARSC